MIQHGWLFFGILADIAILGIAAYLGITSGRRIQQGAGGARIQKYFILSLFFVGIILLGVLLYSALPDKLVKSNTISNIQYNSSATDPLLSRVKEYSESENASLVETTIQFKMKAQELSDYGNIFQTSAANSGIRMELLPTGSFGMAIGAGIETGFKGYTLIPNVQKGQWYTVRVAIDKKRNIKAYINNQKTLDVSDPSIVYFIDDIAIGTGFSKTRRFHGEITDFTLQYRFFDDSLKKTIIRLVIVGILCLFIVLMLRIFTLTGYSSPLGNSPLEISRTTFLVGLAAFVSVSACIYGIVYGILQLYHPYVNAAAVNFFIEPCRVGVRPEPVERMQFFISVVITPFLVLLFWNLFSRLFAWCKLKSSTLMLLYWTLSLGSVIGILAFAIRILGKYPLFFGASEAIKKPWVLLVVPVFFIVGIYLFSSQSIISSGKSLSSRIGSGVLDMLAFVVIGVVVITHIFNKNVHPGAGNHFDAVFYSVSQVLGGKTLLVDCISQYGLYPHFLEPILRLVGGTILNFSILMSLLLGLCFFGLWIVFKQVVKNRMIAFLGFLTVIYTVFQVKIFTGFFDPYYQYFPIRLLFTYLMLFLITNYFIKPRAYLYYGMLFCAACGFLWNMDTGLVAFFSVVLALIYSELISGTNNRWRQVQKSLQHISKSIGMVVVVVSIYSLYAFIRSGHFPNFAEFALYQKLFYENGFAMIPMPPVHPWWIVVAIYLIGLLYSLSHIIHPLEKADFKAVIIFFVAILGIGVFSYYQGRSHDFNLVTVSYPAWILVTIFADVLWEKIIASKTGDFDRAPYFVLILFVFTLPFVSVFEKGHQIQSFFNRGLMSFQTSSCVLDDYIMLIKKHTHSWGKVFMDTWMKSAILHSESQTISVLDIPGPGEIILQKDFDVIHAFLSTNTTYPVFIDLETYIFLNTLPQPVMYAIADKSRNGKFLELLKIETGDERSKFVTGKDEFLLQYAPDLKSGYPEVVLFPRMILPEKFSIEIWVKPAQQQADHATIASDFDPATGKGWIVRKASLQKEVYEFSSGVSPNNSVTFNLTADQWNYIVLTVNGNTIHYYHNGVHIKTARFAIPWKNSERPLFIGNNIEQEHPFNGKIGKLWIRQGLLSADEIKSDWNANCSSFAVK
jgi:hypothetical protein